MKKPIEMIIDMVDWKEIKGEVLGNSDGLPRATHEGELVIGDFRFKVFQLDNGQRVIDGESLENFFKAL